MTHAAVEMEKFKVPAKAWLDSFWGDWTFTRLSLLLNVKWVIFTGQGFSMLGGRVKYLIFVFRLKVFSIYFISVSSSLLWQYLPKTIWSTGCRAHNNTLTLKHAIWRWLLWLNNAVMHLAKNANLNNSFKQICSDKLESFNIRLHFPITTVV